MHLREAALAAILAVTTAALGAACSGDARQEPSLSPDAPSTTTTSPPALTDAEEGFLLNVRQVTDWQGAPDQLLLEYAGAICQSLGDGRTYEQTVAPYVEEGASELGVQVLAATAVFEFCDEHDPVIEVALGGPEDPQPDPTGDAEAEFLSAVREDPYFSDVSDEMLIMLGTTWCDGFSRGDTLEQTLEYASSMPPASARTHVEASAEFICPEHLDKL